MTQPVRSNSSSPFKELDLAASTLQASQPVEVGAATAVLGNQSCPKKLLAYNAYFGSTSSLEKGSLYAGLVNDLQNLGNEELQEAYSAIEKAFRAVEHKKSISAWIQQGDLLDAIDFLVKKSCGKLSFLRVSRGLITDANEEKRDVLLIPYGKIRAINERVASSSFHSFQHIYQELKGELAVESSDVAKQVIKIVTRQNIPFFKRVIQFILYIITCILGFYYRRKSSLEKIAKVSLGLNITPFEMLERKMYKMDGSTEDVLEYRGPKTLFGKSLKEFQQVNEWFARDLITEARALYTEKAIRKEVSLDIKYGPMEKGSRVVIANADSRLRFHIIEKDQFGESFELTGKVLSHESALLAKAVSDNPIYYQESHKFSTKHLLGRTTEDSMRPKKLPEAQNGKLFVREAQHELLGAAFRFFDKRGAIQVIQRLAPADIHNYVAPLDGKPLSHLEATKYFSELETEHPDLYEQLRIIFKEQENRLERPSQATIDIYGTADSVSTAAIGQKSSILAQNSRKIMFYKHEDGSLSMHVFIGATGVDRVDVDPSTEPLKLGARQGDMQFGTDKYVANKEKKHHAAKASATRDNEKKLRLGQWQGGFPINGSTVISYYLPTDFSLYPKLEQISLRAHYGQGKDRVKLEAKVQMGSPILVKSEVRVTEMLEDAFSNDFFVQGLSEDELSNRAIAIFNKLEEVKTQDQDFKTRILSMLKYSPDKDLFKEKIIQTIRGRLQVIQELKSFVGDLKDMQDVDNCMKAKEIGIAFLQDALKGIDFSKLPKSLQRIQALLNKDNHTPEEQTLLVKWQRQCLKVL
ncbi:MAG: phosphatidylserine decarboxylase [Chlamydiales bacterium]|nr:phosphatidylserine decarboxylase [Chlamydiales bacterium]